MGIQIKGSNDTISASDGSMVLEGSALVFDNESITGISTMGTGHITGTATIDDDLKVGVSTFFVDKSAGNIGIGTAVPGHALDISDDGVAFPSAAGSTLLRVRDAGGGATISIDSSASSTGAIQFGDTAASSQGTILYNHVSNHMQFDLNGTGEKMRILSGGQVAIGTATEGHADADDLTIRTSSRTGMTIRSADDNYGNIFFSDATSGTGEYVGKVQYYHADNTMRFGTNSTDRLIINSTGDVNITGVTTAKSFVPTEGQLANRNVLINGAMTVTQRGDGSYGSLGSTAENQTLDRWVLYVQNSAARFTVSQDSESPDGFAKSIKIDCTTADTSLAATDEVQFFQKVEGFNCARFNKGTSSALQYTLSFWAKTNKTGTYIVRLLGRDNTNRSVSASYTVSDSNWNKYVLTFPADTTGKDNADNGEALRVVWWLVAGSGVDNGTLQTTWTNSTDTGAATGQVNFADSTSNDFYLTGTQMEVGSVATPFEHRNYTEELLRCQRYYQELPTSGDHVMWGFGRAESNSARMQVPLSTPLRDTPSITCSNFRTCNVSGTMLQSTTTPTVYKWAADFASIILDFPSGGTLSHNHVYIVTSDGGSTGLQLSAEL